MLDEWRTSVVADLQRQNILLVEDGNHGEYRPRPDEFVDRGVVFIRAADMDSGRVLFDSASKINERARQRITKGIGAPGDILLSHKGTVGKVAIVPDDAPPFVCSPQTTFWRVMNSDVLDRKFLYAFLRSSAFHAQLASRAGETDMAPYVSLTSQRGLTVFLPPINEQRAIAHILGTLDDKIELNRRMNETLESIAKAIFKSWFVDFDPVRAKAEGRDTGLPKHIDDLFPDSFVDSELGEIPKGWHVRALYDCADYINGSAFRNDDFSSDRTGLPIIKIGELKDGITGQTKFTEDLFDSKYRISNGAILFSWSGSPDTSIDTFIWTNGEGWLNQHIFKIQFKRPEEKHFVYFLLRHLKPIFIEIARNKQTTGLGHITAQDLRRLETVFPTDNIILAFNKIAAPIFQKVFSTKLEGRILQSLRDSLLPKLISGELRIKETEKFLEKQL